MTAHPRHKNRRRNLLVLPRLQGRFMRQCTAWPLLTFAVAAVTVGIAWRQVLVEAAELDTVLPSLGFLLGAFTTMVGVATFVILFQAVVVSNRIAGPVYQMRQALEAVRGGDLGVRVQLRESDLLQETADELNTTLELLQQRIEGRSTGPVVSLEDVPSLLDLDPEQGAEDHDEDDEEEQEQEHEEEEEVSRR